ncbi:hypothetical protein K504DRAFT_449447 [Pleomassaria siparia CBS 279.74]|uniref:Uncharacterized protein n=1 Tax=Pleomassaria siparia CBS 279.74 TaxID=1314801 RepID=A0A6G1JV02_9PLEO|nr:hypothetical protein K504DRAFT_449447 [Pleomassaria siparia CBS 279.74]
MYMECSRCLAGDQGPQVPGYVLYVDAGGIFSLERQARRAVPRTAQANWPNWPNWPAARRARVGNTYVGILEEGSEKHEVQHHSTTMRGGASMRWWSAREREGTRGNAREHIRLSSCMAIPMPMPMPIHMYLCHTVSTDRRGRHVHVHMHALGGREQRGGEGTPTTTSTTSFDGPSTYLSDPPNTSSIHEHAYMHTCILWLINTTFSLSPASESEISDETTLLDSRDTSIAAHTYSYHCVYSYTGQNNPCPA